MRIRNFEATFKCFGLKKQNKTKPTLLVGGLIEAVTKCHKLAVYPAQNCPLAVWRPEPEMKV
jgi:hypothetical protein